MYADVSFSVSKYARDNSALMGASTEYTMQITDR